MEIKLSDAVKSSEALKKLFDSKISCIKKTYELSKLMDAIKPELERFHTIRNDKLKEYGTEKDNGNYHLEDEKFELFTSDMEQLGEFTIKLNDVSIKIDDIKETDLTPSDMNLLHWIIKE